ncbi:MAG TPA: hypothetical protein VFQ48_04285 [Pseudonocardiaceae bacterium]|jgi:hypothetical protein|nr:hypothetical protein [Pseudonocardiaceae bacterium]
MQHSTVETVAVDDEATFGTIPQLRVQGLRGLAGGSAGLVARR